MDRAEVAYRRGRFADFSRDASRAAEMLESLKTAPADVRNPIDSLFAAMAVIQRGMALRELGEATEALAQHDDSVARMKALGGPKASRDILFHDCEARRERAKTAMADPERWAAAATDLGEVIPVAETLVNDHPQVAFYRQGLASDYLGRGELLLLMGKPDAAAADLAKSLTISRELLTRHGPLSDSLLVRAQTYLALGKARAAAGKTDEALGHWKNAITIFGIALKTDPDNAHHQRGLAEARIQVGPPR